MKPPFLLAKTSCSLICFGLSLLYWCSAACHRAAPSCYLWDSRDLQSMGAYGSRPVTYTGGVCSTHAQLQTVSVLQAAMAPQSSSRSPAEHPNVLWKSCCLRLVHEGSNICIIWTSSPAGAGAVHNPFCPGWPLVDDGPKGLIALPVFAIYVTITLGCMQLPMNYWQFTRCN
jgi:hypothetical protein